MRLEVGASARSTKPSADCANCGAEINRSGANGPRSHSGSPGCKDSASPHGDRGRQQQGRRTLSPTPTADAKMGEWYQRCLKLRERLRKGSLTAAAAFDATEPVFTGAVGTTGPRAEPSYDVSLSSPTEMPERTDQSSSDELTSSVSSPGGSNVESKQLSETEQAIVKVFPELMPATQQLVAYHWDNFKAKQSGLPLFALGACIVTHGMKLRPGEESSLWTTILRPSPEARRAFVRVLRPMAQITWWGWR